MDLSLLKELAEFMEAKEINLLDALFGNGSGAKPITHKELFEFIEYKEKQIKEGVKKEIKINVYEEGDFMMIGTEKWKITNIVYKEDGTVSYELNKEEV